MHCAYERVLGHGDVKRLLFYHIHNPDVDAKLNFIRLMPEACWLVMVREPIQSCESWVRTCFSGKEYPDIVSCMITMLFAVDDVIFRDRDCMGVRLEDLKNHPQETMLALCDWLGIQEEDSLYEMTAQGKRWWGDLSTPDLKKDHETPFGQGSINRAVGSIFSDRDQFILGTLFYPFSVYFGYVDEDLAGFKSALRQVRPMFDDLFDFERRLIESDGLDVEEFKGSGSYRYLRVGMLNRWNVLNAFHTYPHMLRCLRV